MTADPTRTRALEALYSADSRGLDVIDITQIPSRAAALAEAVWEHRDTIDERIRGASLKWRIDRMPVVDRNVIRLGAYELLFTDTPVGVVISQAVEMAKEYSTARSGAFVNGVLSAVAEGRARMDPEVG